jgi:hypothetical protein
MKQKCSSGEKLGAQGIQRLPNEPKRRALLIAKSIRAGVLIHNVPVYCGLRRICGAALIGNAGTGLSNVLEPARLFSVASSPILESITDG